MDNPPYEICLTDDGSRTVRRLADQVTYHSMRGALQGSLHVYFHAGLSHLTDEAKDITIFEVGFGTGLNALLSYRFALKHQIKITYHSIEKHKLPESVYSQLRYPELLSINPAVFEEFHDQPAGKYREYGRFFDLIIHEHDIFSHRHDAEYDVVFFDAFGPGADPEIWQDDVLHELYKSMRSGSCLVTFCAQGEFKRRLKALNFFVEGLAGPPGKREMTRAWK